MRKPITIIFADDHPLVREGIRSTLAKDENIFVLGEAANGVEVLQICTDKKPDILLLDINMPELPATKIVASLFEHCPDTKIIILTIYDDEAHVRSFIEMGVSGYIVKEEAADNLLEAIHTVVGGETWFSQRIISKLLIPKNTCSLTIRELEVLSFLGRGFTVPQIAEELHIAERTVHYHIENILTKLHAHNRTEAVAIAVRRELISI